MAEERELLPEAWTGLLTAAGRTPALVQVAKSMERECDLVTSAARARSAVDSFRGGPGSVDQAGRIDVIVSTSLQTAQSSIRWACAIQGTSLSVNSHCAASPAPICRQIGWAATGSVRASCACMHDNRGRVRFADSTGDPPEPAPATAAAPPPPPGALGGASPEAEQQPVEVKLGLLLAGGIYTTDLSDFLPPALSAGAPPSVHGLTESNIAVGCEPRGAEQGRALVLRLVADREGPFSTTFTVEIGGLQVWRLKIQLPPPWQTHGTVLGRSSCLHSDRRGAGCWKHGRLQLLATCRIICTNRWPRQPADTVAPLRACPPLRTCHGPPFRRCQSMSPPRSCLPRRATLP